MSKKSRISVMVAILVALLISVVFGVIRIKYAEPESYPVQPEPDPSIEVVVGEDESVEGTPPVDDYFPVEPEELGESELDIMVDRSQEVRDDERSSSALRGLYTADEALALERSNQGADTVLFFHAGWCPTCRQLDTEISSATLPENLTIVKVDYDSAPGDQKRRYNVIAQHSLVLVDQNLDSISSWRGGNLEMILSKVNEASERA